MLIDLALPIGLPLSFNVIPACYPPWPTCTRSLFGVNSVTTRNKYRVMDKLFHACDTSLISRNTFFSYSLLNPVPPYLLYIIPLGIIFSAPSFFLNSSFSYFSSSYSFSRTSSCILRLLCCDRQLCQLQCHKLPTNTTPCVIAPVKSRLLLHN